MDGLIDFLAWCVTEDVHTEIENEQENNDSEEKEEE